MAVILAPLQAIAAESQPFQSKHTTATLISDVDGVEPGHPFHVALKLVMAPGWHSYWRNPGDAGVATSVTFESQQGFSAGPMLWPAPERFTEGSLTTYGYRNTAVFPVTVSPGTVSPGTVSPGTVSPGAVSPGAVSPGAVSPGAVSPGAVSPGAVSPGAVSPGAVSPGAVSLGGPLKLEAHASWLVCREICVPEEADFTLALAAGPSVASAQAAAIAAALAAVPSAAPFTAAISADGTLQLSGGSLPTDVSALAFFPTADGVVDSAGPQPVQQAAGGIIAKLALGPSFNARAGLAGIVELSRSNGAADAFELLAEPGVAPVIRQPVALLLLLALAGGLLLNLMPCVFPILAMKAFALARLSGADRRSVRSEAASYVVGVVAAFTALGAGFMALRQAGDAVGWGFQFQSPIFVTAIGWLLFATGLNMSGVFSLGERLAGTGQSLAARRGHWGSFFTGLLAVVVATPCTASFMTAAIAGAAAEPAAIGLLIFATLGLGLALPYALVALAPRVAAVLPKPGRWMEILRQALAFPMYGATAWLVWVVSQQAGADGVLTAVVGLVGVGFAAWVFGLSQGTDRIWGRRLGFGAAGTALAASLALLAVGAGSTAADPSEPFTAARLAELRTEGRPVFVNVTASWCLSCLVNERLALSPEPVREAFARAHVAYLKGDWTRQDAQISAYLRAQGRDGVPLYVFYAPGKPPAVLPQLLSQTALLDQIHDSGG